MVRIGDRPTVALAVTFALGVFLGVAIVKPWGSTTRPATDFPNESPAAEGTPRMTSVGPEPSVEPVPVAATSCLSSDRQQLVVFERWPGNEVRSWIAVPDRAGSGPLDPSLVSTDVFAAHATAIGVCAASVGAAASGRHAATILDVRVVLGGTGAKSVDAGAPHEIVGGSDGPDPIRLFGPPAAAIATSNPPVPRPSGAASSGRPSASSASPATASAGAARPSGAPTGNAAPSGSPGPTVLPPTWSPGAYTIAFRFAFDPPDTQRWLRFALLHGGGDG